jgi:peptide deformylase
MAILKIARMGHPVLRRAADAVADLGAPDLTRLVADMVETMHDAGGLGLAAPQVHVPLRVVVFHVPERRAGNGDAGSADGPVPLTVLINPVIEPLEGERNGGWEACLSLPGLAGFVPRYGRIRYRAETLDGTAVDRVAEGFHARVVQHECDHLDGILYPQRMNDLALLGFADEITRCPPLASPPEDMVRPEEEP